MQMMQIFQRKWLRTDLAKHKRKLHVEQLEPRLPLDSAAATVGLPRDLTISFVEDGTNVAGMKSDLFAEMSTIGSREQWQGTIVNAFKTWAQLIGAKVSTYVDTGIDVGADPSEGGALAVAEIRIAAVPLGGDVLAIAVPRTADVGGWAGDVLFNSNASLRDLEDLFAVALHEAGHVLGLEHSDDPNSPMYGEGTSSDKKPTVDDQNALKQLYPQPSPVPSRGSLGFLADLLSSNQNQQQTHTPSPRDEDNDGEGESSGSSGRAVNVGRDSYYADGGTLLDPLLRTTLNAESSVNVQSFNVTTPELVQFTMTTTARNRHQRVQATILNADGHIISRLEARSGNIVGTGPVLLFPGEYRVEFEALRDDGGKLRNTDVKLYDEAFSLGLGPGVSDPTDDPMYPNWWEYESDPDYALTDPEITPPAFPYSPWASTYHYPY